MFAARAEAPRYPGSMITLDSKITPGTGGAPVWCPDRGDGTYQNPVLFADYSDPDAVRVDEDYWLTSSSFGHVPGLPILHSRDLVNWSLVNHALPALVPFAHFSQPRHGQGVWAPSIRHHGDKFWIFYPDPDFGLYVVTATDPRGQWTSPVLVKAGSGLIDPCPLWDDDGTAYLIHGWAKSRAGINNRITLHRLSANGQVVIDAGDVIVDGDTLPGWHTIEGPKLYKRGGYYYIFAPAGGVRDGYQGIFRSRNLRGPYENRIVLAQGKTTINGPHQGAWVDTAAGEHWFLHFQEQPAYGRVVHLQPMRWENDWPVMGHNHIGDGPGEPVTVHRKPSSTSATIAVPATTDEFGNKSRLGLQWQWQANPRREWFSLTAAPGALRLSCVPETGPSLWSAGHLLLQKFPALEFEVTTVLRFFPVADGDRAGLVVFGHDYAWVGLRRDSTRLKLVLCRCEGAHQGGVEREIDAHDFTGEIVRLRVSVHAGGICRFAYAAAGGEFQSLGPDFDAKSSYWVGAKVGLFASAGALPTEMPAGHADVSSFRVMPLAV
jgi:beta-xylosidase